MTCEVCSKTEHTTDEHKAFAHSHALERFQQRVEQNILDKEEAEITKQAYKSLLTVGRIDPPPTTEELPDKVLIDLLTSRGYKVEKL